MNELRVKALTLSAAQTRSRPMRKEAIRLPPYLSASRFCQSCYAFLPIVIKAL
jgi:hypothetical protein